MKIRGPWRKEQIERFLDRSRIPLRVACHGEAGFPVLLSLWFVRLGDRIWCASQAEARVVSLLQRDPRCAFEVAGQDPPYRGVRGQGIASVDEDRGEKILEVLMARYLQDLDTPFARWLRERSDSEVAIAIEPRSLVSWDYTRRMGFGS